MTDLDLEALESTIELAIHCLYRYDADGNELESDESKAVRALVAEVKRLRLAQTNLTVGLGQSGRYGEWARGEIVRLSEEVRLLRNPTSNDKAIEWVAGGEGQTA